MVQLTREALSIAAGIEMPIMFFVAFELAPFVHPRLALSLIRRVAGRMNREGDVGGM
jgi:hypothetical protein